MGNSLGKVLKVELFGESHSDSVGVVIDAPPAGLCLDFDEIGAALCRRSSDPKLTSKRKERNLPIILSGFFNGKTTGTPLCAVFKNEDIKSDDYDKNMLRPSHADYTAKMRYNGNEDYRGGGHFSGRLTTPLVFAGEVCRQYLKVCGVEVFSHIQSVGEVCDDSFSDKNLCKAKDIVHKKLPFLNDEAAQKAFELIERVQKQGDSVGGVIECVVVGMRPGIGSPFFDSVESRISAMMFSIPGVLGVEFGMGFSASRHLGSMVNDELILENNSIKTKTNNCGGVNGGISNGMPIIFRTALKPTPSIALKQMSVDLKTGVPCELEIKGRHDACIALKAAEAIAAATAIVAADLCLEAKTYDR